MFEDLWGKVTSFFEKNGGTIVVALIIFVVGLILIKAIKTLLKKALKKSKHIDPICHRFIVSLTEILLYILLIIMTLSKLNVDMSSMVALLSVVSLSLGLAIQDSLSNVAGGFIVLFSKPFKVGDFVDLGGVSGTVRHINILQTKLLTPDNKAIYIPNGQVSAAKITNFSAEELRRLDLSLDIDYQDNAALAKSVISEVIAKHPLAKKEPAPTVRIGSFENSAVRIVVRVWVKNESYWDLNFDLIEQIKDGFDKNGISIPFNQLDVHIKEK